MRIEELAGSIGAVVHDVDVRGGFTAEDIDAVRTAFRSRRLLVFPGQTLAPEEQVGFVGRFGPLCPERQLWSFISNARPDGIVREGALRFHSDFAFARQPTLAISLHAIEVPASGAPTVYASGVAALASMSPAMVDRLRSLQVRNIYDFTWPDDQRLREHQMQSGMPRTDHPMIGRHPVTGEDVLLANEMHTDRVLGLDEAESEALLAEVFAMLYAPANCYTHHWQRGDLVLWDNVALQHGRPAWDRAEARTMQRVALGNYTAVELVPNLPELLARR